MSQSLHRVHVRVNDAATGKPTPVRLRLTDAEGRYYAPFGRLEKIPTQSNEAVGGNLLLGNQAHAYIDGSCEVLLPPGAIHVEICKGPEYIPVREIVNLGVGKMALRFTIQRGTDLRGAGWYSGDTRCHFLSPHDALYEAAAEDLAVIELLATECDDSGAHGNRSATVPNILAFSGQRPALESPGHMVVVNTHNRHPTLGSLGLLNCHRTVYPLSFGRAGQSDDWTMAAWCDQCHRKNGLVVWTNTDERGAGFAHGEPGPDLILGKVDGFELTDTDPLKSLRSYYDVLNCGFRLALLGASGKRSNAVALGGMRTYAFLGADQPLTYPAWIEALRAGRTFVTNRTLLEFEVNGQKPGSIVKLDCPNRTVHVRVSAQSQLVFQRIELLLNGVVVEQRALAEPAEPFAWQAWDVELPIRESGWMAVRCLGAPGPSDQFLRVPFAHTSPIYLVLEGE